VSLARPARGLGGVARPWPVRASLANSRLPPRVELVGLALAGHGQGSTLARSDEGEPRPLGARPPSRPLAKWPVRSTSTLPVITSGRLPSSGDWLEEEDGKKKENEKIKK